MTQFFWAGPCKTPWSNLMHPICLCIFLKDKSTIGNVGSEAWAISLGTKKKTVCLGIPRDFIFTSISFRPSWPNSPAKPVNCHSTWSRLGLIPSVSFYRDVVLFCQPALPPLTAVSLANIESFYWLPIVQVCLSYKSYSNVFERVTCCLAWNLQLCVLSIIMDCGEQLSFMQNCSQADSAISSSDLGSYCGKLKLAWDRSLGLRKVSSHCATIAIPSRAERLLVSRQC